MARPAVRPSRGPAPTYVPVATPIRADACEHDGALARFVPTPCGGGVTASRLMSYRNGGGRLKEGEQVTTVALA